MNLTSVFSRLEEGNPQRIWTITRLLALAADLPVEQVHIETLNELDRVSYLGKPHTAGRLTLREMAEHARLIEQADLSVPIVLSQENQVLVGLHSVAKAYLSGVSVLPAKRFTVTPEPERIRDLPNWLEESLERAKEGYATVHPAIFERFPHYTGVMLYVRDIENGPSDEYSQGLLRAAEAAARLAFSESKLSEHPHIQAWRTAFSDFGVKPSKMLNSSEALIARVLKGQESPAINWLTDVYNALSIRHVLPIGGEDWDKASGTQRLAFAKGNERFDTIQNGTPVAEAPQAGEVIWYDDDGVTCRAWNWRQCVRTRLTEGTRHAYFVLDSLAPFAQSLLLTASAELQEALRRRSPNCEIKQFILRRYIAPGDITQTISEGMTLQTLKDLMLKQEQQAGQTIEIGTERAGDAPVDAGSITVGITASDVWQEDAVAATSDTTSEEQA
jgi:DNA/RNA-binding domain of Phe-tRNA-synthetase-like protein